MQTFINIPQNIRVEPPLDQLIEPKMYDHIFEFSLNSLKTY